MNRGVWALVAGGVGLVGCVDERGDVSSAAADTSATVTEAETTRAPRAFADVVNGVCDQRNAALGSLRHDVLTTTVLLDVNDVTRAYAANVLGVMRDQIPYLHAAPGAPAGWDALVEEYEARASESNADAGDAAAVAFAYFDPFRDLDRRAYELGATRCPLRLLDGATRTPEEAIHALAAYEVCMDLLTVYGSAVLATGGFGLGPRQLVAFRASEEIVDELSSTITREWARAEPSLRAISAPAEASATIAGLIDAIDAALDEMSGGTLEARKEVIDGRAFENLDDEALERHGLLACTLRDYL